MILVAKFIEIFVYSFIIRDMLVIKILNITEIDFMLLKNFPHNPMVNPLG